MKAPTLEGERIRLVELGMDALEDMFEYSKMPEFYAYMELPPHRNIEDTRKYLEKLLGRVKARNSVYWAIRLKDAGKVIGTFGVVDIDANTKRAQIGYGISPLFWGQGFFKEALTLVLEYCYDEIGLERIAAVTMADNLPSINGLKHIGFREEGRLRKYYCKPDGTRHDAVILGLLKNEFFSHRKSNQFQARKGMRL